MEKAYMIRNDGKAIPVLQHLYGNIDEITETLFAGEWLYNNTRYDKTKENFIKLVALYARFYEELENSETLIKDLITVINSYPYKYLSVDFVEEHKDQIQKEYDSIEMSAGKSEMQEIAQKVINELNQEFLRARYGGLYNTSSFSKEMVFRVSSTQFNWYNIIWKFVYSNESEIDTVTIVRDEESTGVSNKFYRAKDGTEYNQMPIDDFIVETGNPVIETKDPVRKLLQSGAPLSELKNLKMNKERIDYRFKCLFQQENRLRTFWMGDLEG